MSTSSPGEYESRMEDLKKVIEELTASMEAAQGASTTAQSDFSSAFNKFSEDMRDRVVSLDSDEGTSMKEEMEKGREGGGKRDEKIIAIYAYDEGGKPLWFFREWDVSSIFRHVFGAAWEMRVYSNEFFENMLKQLDNIKTRKPIMVTMSIHYEWMIKEGVWKGTKEAVVGIRGHFLRLETLTGDFLLEDVASVGSTE
jgi:hypothetical protein